MIKNQFGFNIKRISSDNAKDNFNLEFNSFGQKEGIIHESLCANTTQQNGIPERKNGHLLEQIGALLFQYHALLLRNFGWKHFLLSLILSMCYPLKS